MGHIPKYTELEMVKYVFDERKCGIRVYMLSAVSVNCRIHYKKTELEPIKMN